MTSKIVVNNIESDAGVSTVFFNSDIGGTGGTLNVDGNLNVDGVLTYEDVTNIDSVGVITARDGIVISEDNAIHFRGTAADDADAILRASAGGGQLLINSRNDAIINIDSNNDSTDAHFAVAHGAATGSSTELFRVQENGNVGIGLNNPDWHLDIKSTSVNAVVRLKSSGSTNGGQLQVNSDDLILRNRDAGNLQLWTNDTERLHIKSDGKAYFTGNLGLGGQTSPASTIHINNFGNDGYELKLTGNALQFNRSSNSYIDQVHDSGSILFRMTSSHTEAMRIMSDGTVKIGTGTGNPILMLNASTSGTSVIQMGDSADNNIGQIHYVNSDDSMRFFTNNAERLRIDSTGDVRFAGTNLTNNTNKNVNLTAPSYNTSEEDVNLVQVENESGMNQISFGGGTSALNAATTLRFLTASAINTTTGTERLRITSGGDVGINETSPDTNLHISRSTNQNDTHGILKIESTSTGTGAQTNASLIAKNRYGWSQFMQWEENGLRVGSRSTSTGGTGTVTVTYGADNIGAVINQNGVVTMPQQCGFHVVLHTSQTLSNNGMVNLWDTDASDSRSYIKNMTFNAGRFVAPVSGLYYFTAQLLLSGVANSDDSIHIAWTTGSGNDTFAYWNTRHDGASANGSYGYGGYLPVTGSTTVYLAANAIFGIRANFTGGIGVHGTDANWGHWSGFLVG